MCILDFIHQSCRCGLKIPLIPSVLRPRLFPLFLFTDPFLPRDCFFWTSLLIFPTHIWWGLLVLTHPWEAVALLCLPCSWGGLWLIPASRLWGKDVCHEWAKAVGSLCVILWTFFPHLIDGRLQIHDDEVSIGLHLELPQEDYLLGELPGPTVDSVWLRNNFCWCHTNEIWEFFAIGTI